MKAEFEALLTPAEVAAAFRVDERTVTRWAKAGKLSSTRTMGGHRRYKEAEVRELLAGASFAVSEPKPDPVDRVGDVQVGDKIRYDGNLYTIDEIWGGGAGKRVLFTSSARRIHLSVRAAIEIVREAQ